MGSKKKLIMYRIIFAWSRTVWRQPAHLYTQAEAVAYVRDSSRVPLLPRPFIYLNTPYDIGSVPSLSGRICVSMAFTAESPPSQQQGQ